MLGLQYLAGPPAALSRTHFSNRQPRSIDGMGTIIPWAVAREYQQWAGWHRRHHFVVDWELPAMRLYPPIVNLLFGGRLQYMAVLRVD